MQRSKLQILVVVAGMALGSVAAAHGHGTVYQVLEDTPTVAAEFAYADGKPMQYSAVLVFGPDDDEVEHQNGRTDRLGRFAFCPDRSGTWRVEVSDGMGHKVVAEVDVQMDSGTAAAVGHQGLGGSVAAKTVAGLSLLANVALLAHLWQRRRREGNP